MMVDTLHAIAIVGAYAALALFVIALCYALAATGRNGVEAVRHAGIATAFAVLGLLALDLSGRLCTLYGYRLGP